MWGSSGNPSCTHPQGAKLLHNWEMDQPCSLQSSPPATGVQNATGSQQSSDGRYRVRPQIFREQSVPQQTTAPRFSTRDDAETFAQLMAQDRHQTVVVEKLAPAGCWLQLSIVAGWAA